VRIKLAATVIIGLAGAAIVWVQSGCGADGQPASTKAADSKRFEPIFEGWPKPKVALVFTGAQQGYIEPCGCSGKENQKGGLSRRDTMLRQLNEKGWPVVAMDVGGEISRFGREQELKYQATADALRTMGYQAIGFGPDDLRLSGPEVFVAISPVGNEPSPFVSANVTFAFDPAIPPRYRVINVGGKKIGITSIISPTKADGINNQDITIRPAEQALKDVLPKLQAEKCDLLILMANATKPEAIALAKKFPGQFDIVFSSDGFDEPPAQPTMLDAKTQLVEVGHKGMFATVIGVYDEAPKFRAQRVPLDARFPDSKRMTQVMASYQDQLKGLGLSGLGLKPASFPNGRVFVGSQECKDCHEKAYKTWKGTPHSHALETLVHLDPSRQFDPECLSCHVTGWDPQKFTPFVGGYLSQDKTPLLGGNGCENCHGPGSAHVAAEQGTVKASEAELTRLRREMQLSIATPEGKKKVIANCSQCHDGDNSINFKGGDNFDEYWKKVEHHGKN
jgi:hypothetical protein